MKRILAIVLLTGLAATATAQTKKAPAASQPEPAKPQPKIAATVNGEVITVEELERHYARLSPQMREQYEKNGGKMQFLDWYINKRLVVQEAIKQRYEKTPEGAFDVEAAREAALFDSYIRNVVASSIVSESDIVAYYEANKEQFKAPPMIRARHIIATPTAGNIVNTTGDDAKNDAEALEKIRRISIQLNASKGSFAEAAAQFSEDGSATSGGDLGWFPRGKMVPEFEEVAFTLKTGEISHVVKTQFGYHLIQLVDRRDEGYLPLSELRGDIQEGLLRERGDKIMQEVQMLTRELRDLAKVSINRENL
jgi:peptidyl-prolyl cis-trans isomerase C